MRVIIPWPDRGIGFLQNHMQFVEELWRGQSAWVEGCLGKSSQHPLNFKIVLGHFATCSRAYLQMVWPSLDLNEAGRIMLLVFTHVLLRVWWFWQERRLLKKVSLQRQPTRYDDEPSTARATRSAGAARSDQSRRTHQRRQKQPNGELTTSHGDLVWQAASVSSATDPLA